jgi:DNA-binding response OmpR family regulator
MTVVLVVDDDPADRKPLVRLLEMEGYVVDWADDAVVALACVMNRCPNLILLDIAIPGLDGLTFLWRIRETSVGREIPVIIITGHDEEENVRRAYELGVKEYLVKSRFKTSELLELVRRYASRTGEEAEGVASES